MLGRARGLGILQRQPERERNSCDSNDGDYAENRTLLHESAA